MTQLNLELKVQLGLLKNIHTRYVIYNVGMTFVYTPGSSQYGVIKHLLYIHLTYDYYGKAFVMEIYHFHKRKMTS